MSRNESTYLLILAKEFHPSVVLGVAAAVKTQGKTTPKKKLQAMKNQKSSTNDSVGEKVSVNKRKRGQPRKFIVAEPKQKIGMVS